MPTPPKTLAAMSKHLTAEEKEKIQQAEASVNPDRQQIRLEKPKWLSVRKGGAYWDSILARMEGTAILDDLDTEMLAIYCSQLAERAALQRDLSRARTKKQGEDPDMDQILAITKQINAKDAKIRDFANDLGCTPSGRVRLAVKRASAAADAAAAAENDSVGRDLFGD